MPAPQEAQIVMTRCDEDGGCPTWDQLTWDFVVDVIENQQTALLGTKVFQIANRLRQVFLQFEVELPLKLAGDRAEAAALARQPIDGFEI